MYHDVAKYAENYAPNHGYQGIPRNNFPEHVHGQYMPAGVNIKDMLNKIADVIQNHFDLKPKEQTYLYRHPYLEWFDRVALPP